MSRAEYPNSQHDSPHARIYDRHMRQSPWKDLSGNAFKLLVMWLAAWRPSELNYIPAGGKRVGELIGVSENTGRTVVDELIAFGHVREERRGRNSGRVGTRERVVSLTRHDTETLEGDADWPLKLWRKRQANPQKTLE